MMANMRPFYLLSLLSFVYLTFAAPSSLTPSLATKRNNDVVKFSIDLTWADYNAVGGVIRKAILTNGTIPGPALKLKIGQTVEFAVHNGLPFETSVHFHGITQLGTPWSDGVTGVTQRPIPAGTSFLYKWTADEAGTYMYHAHHKGQMMDGLYGAIIIEEDATVQRPFSIISSDTQEVTRMLAAELKNQPVFISDWSQFTFDEFYHIQQAVNIDDSCTDAIVVNGKGAVFCRSRADIDAFTAPTLKPLLQAVNPPQLTNKGCFPPNLPATQGNFTFNLSALPDAAYFTCTPSMGDLSQVTVHKEDGWASLTFINSGGFSSLKFTIDNHKMWVYAVSGAYVIPQRVDQVVVSVGERFSVLIKLDQPIATYKINVANSGLNQLISGYADFVYQGSGGPAPNAVSCMNWAGINTTAITTFNTAGSAPFNAPAVPLVADATLSFNIHKMGPPSAAYEWTLSGSRPYHISSDDAEPLLFQDANSVPSSDLILKTQYGQWVDLIVRIQGPLAQPHPLHKHGNKAFVIGQGVGPFNYKSVAEAAAVLPAGTFNFKNPPYRDTYVTTPATGNSSWIVLRYKADIPGAWIFHCHIQTHFAGGMAVVLMDAPDHFPPLPAEYGDGGNGYPKGSQFYSLPGGSNSTWSSASSSSSSSTPSPTSTPVASYTGSATRRSLSTFVAFSATLLVLAFNF